MDTLDPRARIRPKAAADLESIVRFLDRHSETAGDHFLKEFFDATALLAEMPRLGPIRHTRGRFKGLRSWPLTRFDNYLIFYFPMDGGIEVARVLHGARNVERELRENT